MQDAADPAQAAPAQPGAERIRRHQWLAVLGQAVRTPRGGTGLERFYSALGWEVTGRWPGALRFAPGDDRDEILMILAPL